MTTPDPVTIRPATADDLEAVVDLWLEMMAEHEAFDPRVRLSISARSAYRNYALYHIEREDAPVFVVEKRGEIIAYCLAYCARSLPMFRPSSYGFISDLVVGRAWRRQGLGTALLERVRAWFAGRGIRSLQLQVYSRNAPGLQFWQRVGFSPFVHGMWMGLREEE
jgi:GNAT superfamily N-acetyltransferase